jgi:hypothetical protein
MNNDYKSHAKLYTIKDDNNNISNSIELDYNSILLLTATNTIKLVTINKNQSQKIIDEKKEINNLLVDEDKSIKSVRKLSKNVICFNIDNNKIKPEKEKTSIIDDDDYQMDDDDSEKNNMTINCPIEHFILGERLKTYCPIVHTPQYKETYIKIIYLNPNSNEENGKKRNDNNILNIKKEYIFQKNYELLRKYI